MGVSMGISWGQRTHKIPRFVPPGEFSSCPSQAYLLVFMPSLVQQGKNQYLFVIFHTLILPSHACQLDIKTDLPLVFTELALVHLLIDWRTLLKRNIQSMGVRLTQRHFKHPRNWVNHILEQNWQYLRYNHTALLPLPVWKWPIYLSKCL